MSNWAGFWLAVGMVFISLAMIHPKAVVQIKTIQEAVCFHEIITHGHTFDCVNMKRIEHE